jgi:tetratricopeptide (TPR) repeat protein
MACLGEGHLSTARAHLEEALALARDLGDKRELAAALCAVGQLYRIEGALDKAELLYESVLGLARELGDVESRAIGLLNLAMVAICRRSEDRAREILLEIADIATAVGSQRVGLSAMEVSAGMSALCADWERAARFYGAAEAQTENTGFHRDPADEAFLAPLVEKARHALGAEAFTASEASGRALTYEKAMSEARAWLEKATV